MRKLPYDYFRCMGEKDGKPCPKREDCIRFTQLKETAPWTAYTEHACATDKYEDFILDENPK